MTTVFKFIKFKQIKYIYKFKIERSFFHQMYDGIIDLISSQFINKYTKSNLKFRIIWDVIIGKYIKSNTYIYIIFKNTVV